MPPKRQAPILPSGGNEHSEAQSAEEFTRAVKKRLSSSTRTGQACDRCKIRKIRCDGLPDGCSPCLQNRTECRTTDRISHRAVPRGYIESLETKCYSLETKLKEMEATLERMAMERSGHNPTHFGSSAGHGMPSKQEDSLIRTNGSHINWPHTNDVKGNGYPAAKPLYGQNKSPEKHPSFRQSEFRTSSSCGNYYLGLSSGCPSLTSMKASALSVLGIEIDLSDLDPSQPTGTGGGIDDSYASCLSSMLNVNSQAPQKLDLPPKQEGMVLVDWFMKFSYPYLPIMHRPTFMTQLERMYDDRNYQPSAGMICQAHMVFAIVLVTAAKRDQGLPDQYEPTFPNAYQRSFEHYHYALSFFYHLLHSATLEDLQALCLIVQHLRSFSKPGAAWFLARLATSMAVELGLHRSSKKWHDFRNPHNVIEDELRKRVWWCLYTMEVHLGSKLGRPMSMREADYDTELPEGIDDEYITESGFLSVPEGKEGCLFDVGIELFKVIPLYSDMNITLYAVARPREKYVELVENLEARLLQWRNNRPKWINAESPTIERRFQSLHLEMWFHECRILMRHPSLSLSPSPTFKRDSLKICVESSRAILYLTDKIRKDTNHVDTTWYSMTVELLATLTILFSMWERRDSEVTQGEIDQFKADMDLCQDILGHIGRLLGSPNQLREMAHKLTQKTLEFLHHKQNKNQSPPSSLSVRPYSRGPAASVCNGGPQPYAMQTNTAPDTYSVASASVHPHSSLPSPISPALNGRAHSIQCSHNLSGSDYSRTVQPHLQTHYMTPDGLSMPETTYSDQLTSHGSPSLNGIHNGTSAHGGYPQQSQQYSQGARPLSLDAITHHNPHHQPQSHHHQPPIQPHPHPIFPWGYSGNDSWNKFSEYLSTIPFETGASDLYSASALMTLSNNTLLNAAAAALEAGGAGAPGARELSTADQLAVSVSAQANDAPSSTTVGPAGVAAVSAAGTQAQWMLPVTYGSGVDDGRSSGHGDTTSPAH